MKHLIIICCALTIGACADAETSQPAVQKKKAIENIDEKSYALGDTIKTKALENQDEVKDGPVIINYPNGTMKAKGILKDGMKNSLWESYYEDGTKQSSTYFIKGKQHGHTVTYHPNGNVLYKGEYREGKRMGHWVFYDENGNVQKEINY